MTPPRYQDPEVARIWLESQKIRLWTCIEMMHLEQLSQGNWPIPPARTVTPTVEHARREEVAAGHDVGGFLQALEDLLVGYPEAQRWLHFGLTSSDLVDTTNALRVNDTTRHLLGRWGGVWNAACLPKFKVEVDGRTHGQVASPTTIQHRWLAATHALAYTVQVPGMFSGAVGTYAEVTPTHAADLCAALHLEWWPATTQVLPRRLFVGALRVWVDWLTACEQIALDVRLMSMTGDVSEPSRAVGSSAMPGKTNPARAERICGLARDARARLHAVEEGQSLWLDRDLSHSAVDRIEFEDIAHLVGFGLSETATLLNELQVHPQFDPNSTRSTAERRLAHTVRVYNQPRSESYRQVRFGRPDDGAEAPVTGHHSEPSEANEPEGEQQ